MSAFPQWLQCLSRCSGASGEAVVVLLGLLLLERLVGCR